MSASLALLQEVFGYPAFRGRQGDVVDHVTAGGDALVLMPTGGGKSLCYQIPALLRRGVGIVVSPLIALMHDQVAALREAGSEPLVMTRDLMAPEVYVLEAMARGLGDRATPRELRQRVVAAYARWQRIPERTASTIFARGP